MNILIAEERLNHIVFFAEGSDDAEFDLRIVGREEHIIGITSDERLAHLLPTRGADRDILQVRIVATKSTCSRYRLHISSMHATRTFIYL